jgi:2-amino-4-hydroxy-6-hydroxymethyldihydropteridine diphosphokinase
MPVAYIALGSNLGDRLAHLRQAVRALRELGEVESVSPVYETEPVGYADQPRFLNAVLRLRTELSPRELLERMQEIERQAGRVRPFPNAPRTLDLDLILYDDTVMETPELTLPHPRFHERAFVLRPLVDIAPDVVHPLLDLTAREMLARLEPVTGIARLPGRPLVDNLPSSDASA